jgi:hypothetical protein
MFGKLKNQTRKMFLSSSPGMADDDAFIEAISNAGTSNIYIVFADEVYSRAFYSGQPRIVNKTLDLVKKIEDKGMMFIASFGVGFDFMGEEHFDYILEFCEKAKINTAEFFLATPFPNTTFWNQIKEDGRLFTPIDWKKYNCANVVFEPKKMSEKKLMDGFYYLWREFYKNKNLELSNDIGFSDAN